MSGRDSKSRYIHPLRQAYNTYVRTHYHVSVYGDKTPGKTDSAAARVQQLGLNYNDFIELAMKLWASYAASLNLPYPYWSMVICDNTFARLGKLLKMVDTDDTATSSGPVDAYQYELSFATAYIEWLQGKGDKPVRELQVDADIKHRVAKQLCMLYGIPYTSTDYNSIGLRLSNASQH